MPKNTAPGAVRLRVPDGLGGSIPGPVLPVSGLSTDTFQGGFGPHAKEILADIPNYTDLSPVLQISEVVVGQP